MTQEELTKLAAQGRDLPEGLDVNDTFLFLCMRNLYSYAKTTDMTKEEGAREKQVILKQYEQLKLWMRVVENNLRKEREFGEAFSAFAKDPTRENADKVHRAWFGCGIKVKAPAEAEKEQTQEG